MTYLASSSGHLCGDQRTCPVQWHLLVYGMTQMNLENITLSEGSQMKGTKCHVFASPGSVQDKEIYRDRMQIEWTSEGRGENSE